MTPVAFTLYHTTPTVDALRRIVVDTWDRGADAAFVAARTTLAVVTAAPWATPVEVHLGPTAALHLAGVAEGEVAEVLTDALAQHHAAGEAALDEKRRLERRDRVPVRESRTFLFPY